MDVRGRGEWARFRGAAARGATLLPLRSPTLLKCAASWTRLLYHASGSTVRSYPSAAADARDLRFGEPTERYGVRLSRTVNTTNPKRDIVDVSLLSLCCSRVESIIFTYPRVIIDNRVWQSAISRLEYSEVRNESISHFIRHPQQPCFGIQ